MRTPREKYRNDGNYRGLVQMLESLIHEAEFTPSELREACILAHILYSESNIKGGVIFPNNETMEALKTLDESFLSKKSF